MPARCLGSTPPPISHPCEGGRDARHQPESAVARSTDPRRHPLQPSDLFPPEWERTIRAARAAPDLKG
jgi:hypothetical protein